MRTAAIPLAWALTACTGSPGVDTAETPSATPTATATTTATETTAASPTDEAMATASATGSPSEGPLGDAQECENEELGYEVDYPEDWWANELIDPGEDDPGFTPIFACTFFAPEPVELQPNAGLPSGIAIRFEIADEEIDRSQEEVLSEDDTTVDGHDARILETEPAPQAGFVPEGSHLYRYVVELDDGRQLVATTDDIHQDEDAYEESKTILDAMMETVEIDD